MTPTLFIGQNCCYWPKGAKKPHAAICVDYDEANHVATLQVFMPNGGRFTKPGLSWRHEPNMEGWNEIGQNIHG